AGVFEFFIVLYLGIESLAFFPDVGIFNGELPCSGQGYSIFQQIVDLERIGFDDVGVVAQTSPRIIYIDIQGWMHVSCLQKTMGSSFELVPPSRGHLEPVIVAPPTRKNHLLLICESVIDVAFTP